VTGKQGSPEILHGACPGFEEAAAQQHVKRCTKWKKKHQQQQQHHQMAEDMTRWQS